MVTDNRELQTLYSELERTRRELEYLRKASTSLEQKNQQLNIVLESTDAGYWDWNMQTGELTVNERWAAITGHTIASLQPIDIGLWKKLSHPEDLASLKYLLEKHFAGTNEYFEIQTRIRHNKGHWVRVMNRGKVIEWDKAGKPVRMVGSLQKITGGNTASENLTEHSRKQAPEKKLEKQLEFEHLITNISSKLINLAIDQLDTVIEDILEIIGEYMQADRSYTFQFYDDSNLMDNTHEWCAEGIKPEIETLKGLSTKIFPWWMEKVRNNETILIPDVSKLPPEAAAEKKTLERQNIKSLIVIPLTSNAHLFGYIGLDTVRQHRYWHPETITVLQLVGAIIANNLMRKQAEQLLETELDLALKLSCSKSLEETLDLCLDTAIAISDMDCGGIYLVEPADASLSLSVHKGLPENFLKHSRSYLPDVLKGNPLYSQISGAGTQHFKEAEKEGLDAIAILPVHYKDDVIACLSVASHRLEHVPNFAKKALETIASHIGAAIMQARHEAETAEAKKNLETLFNTIDDFLFIIDTEGKIIHTNDTFLYDLNYSPEEITRSHILDFHPVHEREQAIKNLKNLFAGKTDLCLLPLQTKEGNLIPVETKVSRGIWNNKPVLFGISRNITGRLRAEKALRESEQRFRELTEQLPQPVFECDLETRITYANNSTLQLFDYTSEDLEQHLTTFDLAIPENHQLLRTCRKKLFEGSHLETLEFTALTRKGKTFPAILYVTTIIDDESITGFRSVVLNLTKHKEIEDALRESELKKRMLQKYQNLLNNIPGIIYTTDPKGEIDFLFSPKVLSITGYRAKEIHTLPKGWVSIIHPDDRKEYLSGCRTARHNLEPIIQSYRIRTKTGQEKWIEDRKAPLVCSDGSFTGADGIMFDITKQAVAESEKHEMELKLQQAQRLETIGTLAGGIAHDFNNILTPIMGYADMLKKLIPSGETATDYLDEIQKASERAKNLVERILAFSRLEESHQTPLNPATIITEALKLIRPAIPSTITIETDIDNNTGDILADVSQIHQLFLNLCTNAYHAMEKTGGKLTIRLRSLHPDPALRKSLPKLQDKPYILLTVTDTGSGMNSKTLERIFEPFFTTKPVNRGTGLGLSVAHGIITQHKGIITVASKPGEGTTFCIYLPIIRREQSSLSTSPSVETKSRGKSSILLVDDETSTIKMMEVFLENNGHTVTTTTSASEAFEILCHKPNLFDLLITNLTMPEMTGIALARKVHNIRPDLPIFLMSGREIDRKLQQTMTNYGIKTLLRKPINFSILYSEIQEVME